MVVWPASRPRSRSSSSTSRNESADRRYQRTAHTISSGSVCRHVTIAGRIAGLMISSGYPPPSATVATQPHIKREQEQARDPKRFRRELIVCAVVAIGATLITLVTVLVLGTILREMAIEMFDTLRVWWAG